MLLRDQSVYQRENSILAQLKDTLAAYERQRKARESEKSKIVRAAIEQVKSKTEPYALDENIDVSHLDPRYEYDSERIYSIIEEKVAENVERAKDLMKKVDEIADILRKDPDYESLFGEWANDVYKRETRMRSPSDERVQGAVKKAKKDSIIDREIQIMYGSVQEVMDILENDGEEGQDLHKTRQFLWDYAKWSGEHTKARGIITGASKGVIQQWIDEDHREHLRKYEETLRKNLTKQAEAQRLRKGNSGGSRRSRY